MRSQEPTQADVLVRVVQEEANLFHDGDTPYAAVAAPEPILHEEILRVRSRAFRIWASGRFWRANGRPMSGQSLSEAIDELSALAIFEGPQRRVELRIAE